MGPATDYQRGDILFYAPKDVATFAELEDESGFDGKFPRVAAFSQGYPYVYSQEPPPPRTSSDADDFKPWFHVAIVTDVDADGTVHAIGFDTETTETQANLQLEQLTFDPAVLGEKYELSVRRPPSEKVDSLVEASQHLVECDTEYSVAGLVSFALATKARMLPDGDLREKLLRAAYGANALAYEANPDQHSCVSAIVAAWGPGLGFEEPAPPRPLVGGLTASELPPELADVQRMLDILLKEEGEEAGSRRARVEDGLRLALPTGFGGVVNGLSGPLGVDKLGTKVKIIGDVVEFDFPEVLADSSVPGPGASPPSDTSPGTSSGDVAVIPDLPVLPPAEVDPGTPSPLDRFLWMIGPLDDLAGYLGLLGEALDDLIGDGRDLDDLVTKGDESVLATGPTHYIVSPAMLWDALGDECPLV